MNGELSVTGEMVGGWDGYGKVEVKPKQNLSWYIHHGEASSYRKAVAFVWLSNQLLEWDT